MDTPDLEGYFSSPEATDYARTLLCLSRDEDERRTVVVPSLATVGGRPCRGPLGHGQQWIIQQDRAWTRVEFFHAVYFRQEGDRFLVSDLGQAVTELRKRTGFWHDHSLLARFVAWPTDLSAQVAVSDALASISSDGAIRAVVSRSELPAALCHCLLMADRVSRLEFQGVMIAKAAAAPAEGQ